MFLFRYYYFFFRMISQSFRFPSSNIDLSHTLVEGVALQNARLGVGCRQRNASEGARVVPGTASARPQLSVT